MGLPTSREFTAAPNTQIPSSGINAIQDAITGSWKESVERTIPTLSSTDNPGGAPGATHVRSIRFWSLVANPTPIYYPLALDVNNVLQEWHVDLVKNDSTNQVQVSIVSENDAGEVAEVPALGSGLALGSINMSKTGIGLTIGTGKAYYLKVTPGGTAAPAADQVFNVRIVYTRH